MQPERNPVHSSFTATATTLIFLLSPSPHPDQHPAQSGVESVPGQGHRGRRQGRSLRDADVTLMHMTHVISPLTAWCLCHAGNECPSSARKPKYTHDTHVNTRAKNQYPSLLQLPFSAVKRSVSITRARLSVRGGVARVRSAHAGRGTAARHFGRRTHCAIVQGYFGINWQVCMRARHSICVHTHV